MNRHYRLIQIYFDLYNILRKFIYLFIYKKYLLQLCIVENSDFIKSLLYT